MKNNGRTDDFLWGSATASYQCEGAWEEGGKAESMWDHYLHENHYENGDVASDHYHRFREDIRTLKEGGQNAYRFSLSWPRIIRNLDGEVNEEGLRFYGELIDACNAQGVDPFVTIYHWDLPQYLQEIGGWLNPKTRDAFVHLCKVVFRAFDGKVRHWSTFNEPKWFLFSGYLSGNYPPEHKNSAELIRCGYNVMLASAMAIREFRGMGIQGQIGLVMSYQTVYGVDDSDECRQAVRNADNYCNRWVSDTCVKGAFPPDLIRKLRKEGYDLSFVQEDELQTLWENTVDFLGVNYYSPTLVKPYTTGETTLIVNNQGAAFQGEKKTVVKNWFEEVENPALEHTEWGFAIYPKGIYDALVRSYRSYHIPLYITENGLGEYEDIHANPIQDDARIHFMNDHIRELLRAKEDGVDVRGYFAWSTFDLYSWKNGCEKRYGLVAVDFENQCRRTPKASYYWYQTMIGQDWKRQEE